MEGDGAGGEGRATFRSTRKACRRCARIARNLARQIRALAAVPATPSDEPRAMTHFIRDDLRG